MFKSRKSIKTVQKDSQNVQELIEKLECGDLELEKIQVTDPSIQNLADGMVHMSEVLNGYVEEISRVLSHLSVGNLTIETSEKTMFYGDFEPIKNALNKISSTLLQSFCEINSIMEDINESGNESAEIAAQVALNEEALSENMNGVLLKSREMDRRTKVAGEKVNELFRNINQAGEASERGKEHIEQMQVLLPT